MRTDRSVLELIDDYTFLNETLAKFYAIPGVEGKRCGRSSCRRSPRDASTRVRANGDLQPHVAGQAPVVVLDNFLHTHAAAASRSRHPQFG